MVRATIHPRIAPLRMNRQPWRLFASLAVMQSPRRVRYLRSCFCVDVLFIQGTWTIYEQSSYLRGCHRNLWRIDEPIGGSQLEVSPCTLSSFSSLSFQSIDFLAVSSWYLPGCFKWCQWVYWVFFAAGTLCRSPSHERLCSKVPSPLACLAPSPVRTVQDQVGRILPLLRPDPSLTAPPPEPEVFLFFSPFSDFGRLTIHLLTYSVVCLFLVQRKSKASSLAWIAPLQPLQIVILEVKQVDQTMSVPPLALSLGVWVLHNPPPLRQNQRIYYPLLSLFPRPLPPSSKLLR